MRRLSPILGLADVLTHSLQPPLTASNPRRPSHTPDPAPPPPAKPSSRLIDAEIACAAASEKLTTANADVERLQAAIDKAEDDAELQKEIDEARKVVEKRREKLEKWRRKVESVRRKEGKSRRCVFSLAVSKEGG